MVEPLPKAVLEAADVSAVSQLILRERVSRDLGLWEQMRDCGGPEYGGGSAHRRNSLLAPAWRFMPDTRNRARGPFKRR